MTYKLSLTMAENLMQEAQNSALKQSISSSSASVTSSSNTQSTKLNNHSNSSLTETTRHTPDNLSNIEALGKKIAGGIRLPFANLGLSNSNNNNSSIDKRSTNDAVNTGGNIEQLNNNSKSKRPISSQMYDSSPTSSSLINEFPSSLTSQTNNHLSSSSNENLIENSSEDELEPSGLEKRSSRSNSRDKKQEDEQSAVNVNNNQSRHLIVNKLIAPLAPVPKPVGKKDPTDLVSSSSGSASMPVPAPRKAKNLVKSLFSGLGVGSSSVSYSNTTSKQLSQLTSPKVNRKQLVQEETKESLPLPIIQHQDMLKSDEPKDVDVAKPLQHLNKSRPKRANVKKPTVKNPQAQIEVEAGSNDLAVSKPEIIIEAEDESQTKKSDEQKLPSPPISTTTTASKALNQVEQPKISLNALENVRLRRTIRVKNNPTTDETVVPATTPVSSNTQTTTVNTPTPTSANNQPNKLGSRFSMFESSNPNNLKPAKKQTDADMNELAEETNTEVSAGSNKTTPVLHKPLPPLPPAKPPRPAYNPIVPTIPGKSDQAQAPNMLVKLRPVSTINNNSNGTLNSNCSTNISTNSKPNLITNENNIPIGIKLTNSAVSTSSASDMSKLVSGKSASEQEKHDKRSSVKELVQLMSEESKV